MRVFHWVLVVLVMGVVGACSRKEAAGPGSGATSGPAAEGKTVTVFVAASLGDVFGDLGKAFEGEHAGVKVEFNAAGSQKLRSQLENGAMADVFASADEKEMTAAVKAGRVNGDSVRVIGSNRLVIITPKGNPKGIKGLADLAVAGVTLDFADSVVPAGKYSGQMLDAASLDPAYGAGFKAKVMGNVTSLEEDVTSVATKVSLGTADAGIVYATDAASHAGDLMVVEIPTGFNPKVQYFGGMVVGGKDSGDGAAFLDFVGSEEGKKILGGKGFGIGG